MNYMTQIKKIYLENININFLVYKENKVVHSSSNKGIFSIYDIFKNNRHILANSFIADKIVGRAIAVIAISCNIKGVYAEVISDAAYDLLVNNDIKVEYCKKVFSILNSNCSDKCPVEKMVENINNGDELLLMLDEFFKGVKNEN